MTDLQKEIFDRLVQTMDIDVSELNGFDENSPLFSRDAESGNMTMGLDSIDALEMVIMIEKHWELPEISNEDMIKFRTIKDISDYIEAQCGKKEQ